MLKNNTIRFGTDEFSFSRQALLKSNQPWDTGGNTAVEGFNISGEQPGGTSRKIIFKVDDALYKFSGDSLVAYPYSGDFADVIEHGNTVAELSAVSSIPAWLNKKIYPIIALRAPADSNALPTVAIGLKVRCQTDIYTKTVESAEYVLASDSGSTPRISEITCLTTCTGNATADVTCRLKAADIWSDWISLDAAKDCPADSVQFKLTYTVTTLDGSDSAKISSITIKHTLGSSKVAGDVAELFSVAQDYQYDLKTCYVIVKHKRLIDSRIEAYVNFRPQTKKRTLIQIGTATGTLQQLYLGVDGVKDSGIDQSTIRLYADGRPLTGFSYNVEVSEVTINTTAGAVITASYDYGISKENWREMSRQITEPYDDGSFMTRFTYIMPDDEFDMKVANVKLRLYRPTGSVVNESLGVGTGGVQMFALNHKFKQDTIRLNTGSWSYDEDSQILTVVAPKDVEIIFSGNWIGESHEIFSWTAGFSV